MKRNILDAQQVKASLCILLISAPLALFAQAPANDDCGGAIQLTVGTDPAVCSNPMAGSTLHATTSNVLSSCNFYANPDVWYTFTATHTTHTIMLSNISANVSGLVSYSYVLALYDGSCGSITNMDCSMAYYYGGTAADATITTYGLTIGHTYYIQVVGENGYNASFSTVANTINFDLCVLPPPPPPANDNCINAVDISNGETVTGSNVGATFSDISPGSCAYWDIQGANDVWYKVTSPVDGQLEITNMVFNNEDMVLEVLTGDCTAASVQDCNNNTFFFNVNTLNINATAGETYLLRVYGYGGNNTSGNFTIKAGGLPLPVQLTRLNGFTDDGNLARLQWQTLREQNSLGFEVQRSADGIYFYKTGFIPTLAPSGNSAEQQQYNFTDPAPLQATTYFRLKQADRDGQTSLSEVLRLNPAKAQPALLSASPNPVTDELRVSLPATGSAPASLWISDLSGRILQIIPEPRPETVIHMSAYAAGVYLLHFSDGGRNQLIRVSKR